MKDKKFGRFEFFFEKYKKEETPPEVESRLRKRLAEFRIMLENRKTNKKSNITLNIYWRASMKKSRLIIGAAAALILIALGIYFNPWSKSPEKAFAAVASKIEETKTMTYKIFQKFEGIPGLEGMDMEIFYKAPGYMRMNLSTKTSEGITKGITIFDVMDKKKGITIMPDTKKYVEIDLTGELKNQHIDEIEKLKLTLPERADEILGKREIDGRMLNGFIVKEKGIKQTIWLDIATGELVRMDVDYLNIKGPHAVMSDFRFNVTLDDSLFNPVPPEGYTLLKKETVNISGEKPEEKEFINFLRLYASLHKEELLPPINNIPEFMNYLKQLDKMKMKEEKELDEKTKKSIQSGMQFFMIMKSENDWHYAGKGVKLGTANKPICWWKPDGSETYRVIYGDLQIRDLSPEELKKPEFNQN